MIDKDRLHRHFDLGRLMTVLSEVDYQPPHDNYILIKWDEDNMRFEVGHNEHGKGPVAYVYCDGDADTIVIEHTDRKGNVLRTTVNE